MTFTWITKVNETLSNSNGHIQSAYDENGGEDKPMLQVKMNGGGVGVGSGGGGGGGGGDDQGINALINRQLQGKQTCILFSNTFYNEINNSIHS